MENDREATEAEGPTDPTERMLLAKKPTSRLTGPYGHPFHAILVTIPIGAWVISFLFDLLSRAADDGFVYARGAYWLVIIGIIGAVAAGVTGTIDLLGITRGTKAFRTGIIHLILNDTITAIFVVSFLIRRGDNGTEPTSIGLIVVSAVALLLLAASGWLGGQLVYRYGVRVAAESDQVDGFADREVS